MHAWLDREIFERDDSHGFMSRHSSHQRGVHTSRVCRIYLLLRSCPPFLLCHEVCRNHAPIFLYGHICELARVVPAQDRF